MPLQPQAAGEQPGRVLLLPHRHPVQPGGLTAGVLGGPEPAADLPLPAQEEHGAAGAPPAAQGEAQPGGGPLRPAQRLPESDRRGLGLPRHAGGRRRPGAGAGGGGGGGGRRAQRVPGDAAGSVHPRPLERALVQPGQPPELRHHGLTSRGDRPKCCKVGALDLPYSKRHLVVYDKYETKNIKHLT